MNMDKFKDIVLRLEDVLEKTPTNFFPNSPTAVPQVNQYTNPLANEGHTDQNMGGHQNYNQPTYRYNQQPQGHQYNQPRYYNPPRGNQNFIQNRNPAPRFNNNYRGYQNNPNPKIETMWTIEPITNHRMATQTIASSSFQIQEQWTDDQGATHAEGLGTSPQRVGIGKLTTQTPMDATISPRCRLLHKWDHWGR
ncbi:hypothetical protein JTB14_023881 [Gonioctena quinquepunctata]|nr:hypothetical protein JTB14_023881 [Gonioctena quinquepunctata]